MSITSQNDIKNTYSSIDARNEHFKIKFDDHKVEFNTLSNNDTSSSPLSQPRSLSDVTPSTMQACHRRQDRLDSNLRSPNDQGSPLSNILALSNTSPKATQTNLVSEPECFDGNNTSLRRDGIPTEQFLDLVFSAKTAKGRSTSCIETLREAASFIRRQALNTSSVTSQELKSLASALEQAALWRYDVILGNTDYIESDILKQLFPEDGVALPLHLHIVLPLVIGFGKPVHHLVLLDLYVKNSGELSLTVHDSAGIIGRALKRKSPTPFFKSLLKTPVVDNIPLTRLSIANIIEILDACDTSFTPHGFDNMNRTLRQLGDIQWHTGQKNKPQITGNCLWKAPMRFIKHNIASQNYQQFKRQMRGEVLQEYATHSASVNSASSLHALHHLNKSDLKHELASHEPRQQRQLGQLKGSRQTIKRLSKGTQQLRALATPFKLNETTIEKSLQEFSHRKKLKDRHCECFMALCKQALALKNERVTDTVFETVERLLNRTRMRSDHPLFLPSTSGIASRERKLVAMLNAAES